LECVAFEESHASVNLSVKIESVITEWDWIKKVGLVVSDNANNIKGAITNLNLKHFGCLAHSLNLIVQHTLKLSTISDTISIVKSIVGHFNRNSNASHELDKYQ